MLVILLNKFSALESKFVILVDYSNEPYNNPTVVILEHSTMKKT
jgi:hypothetical protein